MAFSPEIAKPLMYRILIDLLDKEAVNEDQIIINDFLKTTWRKGTDEDINDLNRINTALDRLLTKGYITKSIDPFGHYLTQLLKNLKTGETYRCDLENTNIQVGITASGYDYITNEIRKDKQDIINEEVRINSRVQKNTAKIVAGLACVTMIISALTFLKSREQPPSSILQESAHMRSVLDSICKHQRGIDSSLQTLGRRTSSKMK